MKRIIEFIKSHKEIVILVFIILLVIANQLLNAGGGKTSTTPSVTPTEVKHTTYKSVVPGESTQDELDKALGNPLSTKDEEGKKISEYKSSSQYRNNVGITENGKVVFIKEIVTAGDNKKSDSLVQQYGQAPFVLYPNKANSSFNLYVYPERGTAYLGHPDGTLLEIWYFVPSTFQEFQKKWAQEYNLTPYIEPPNQLGY